MKPFLQAGLWMLSLMMLTTISSLTRAPAFMASLARRPYSVPTIQTNTEFLTSGNSITEHIASSEMANAIFLLDLRSLGTLSTTGRSYELKEENTITNQNGTNTSSLGAIDTTLELVHNIFSRNVLHVV